MDKELYLQQRVAWKLRDLKLLPTAENKKKVAKGFSKEFENDYKEAYTKPKKTSRKKVKTPKKED